MVGIPGSGKSTAREILNAKYFVSSDWHVERLANERNLTYQEAFKDVIKEATSELNKDVDFMISTNRSFIWDQTNITKKKRSQVLAKIPSHYNKVAVHVDVPLEVSIDRNDKRDRSIDVSIIHTMNNLFERPSLDEGFDAIMTIDQSGNISRYQQISDNDVITCGVETNGN